MMFLILVLLYFYVLLDIVTVLYLVIFELLYFRTNFSVPFQCHL